MTFKASRLFRSSGILLLSCLFYVVSNGQKKETFVKKIYLQGGGGASSQEGFFGELGIQTVLKNNWTASFSYHDIEMDPKNLPADYSRGYTLLLIFPVPDAYPHTNMSLFSFTGGKCFETGRRTWFITEAGFSIVNGEELKFTQQPVVEDWSYISSNYNVTKERKSTIGAMMKADFNWAFLPYVGLGTGVFANFNSFQSPIGFHVSLTCGWMNLKPKQKRHKKENPANNEQSR